MIYMVLNVTRDVPQVYRKRLKFMCHFFTINRSPLNCDVREGGGGSQLHNVWCLRNCHWWLKRKLQAVYLELVSFLHAIRRTTVFPHIFMEPDA